MRQATAARLLQVAKGSYRLRPDVQQLYQQLFDSAKEGAPAFGTKNAQAANAALSTVQKAQRTPKELLIQAKACIQHLCLQICNLC